VAFPFMSKLDDSPMILQQLYIPTSIPSDHFVEKMLRDLVL
jgi:hypothetical protein